MKLKTLQDINLFGKTILYRAPYDIEPEKVNNVLELADDSRIKATLPTIQYLLKENCRIVVLTYVGRPDGIVSEELRTKLHAEKLSELLNHPVSTANDCIGPEVKEQISRMNEGDILMLENARFHKEEMVDDDAFAKLLCEGKDVIVFDGFPQAHRMHSSTTGILRHLPAVAGFYFEQEVNMLSNLLDSPKHPFTVIIGGAKISDKIGAVFNLMHTADTILIGGAVSNVFLKAEGKDMGNSFIEDVFVDKIKREKKDWVSYANDILTQAQFLDRKIIFPVDLEISNGNEIKTVNIIKENVPSGWAAYDIGPGTRENFSKIISQSKTVFVNGPMGKFEDESFSAGSKAVFSAIRDLKNNPECETTIAGGDTIEIARRYGSLEDYSHVSLAGGATLEFLAGKGLPALKALME